MSVRGSNPEPNKESTKIGITVIALPAVCEPAHDLNITLLVADVAVDPIGRGHHFAIRNIGWQVERQPCQLAEPLLRMNEVGYMGFEFVTAHRSRFRLHTSLHNLAV